MVTHVSIIERRQAFHELEISSGTYSETDPLTGHTAFYPNADWTPISADHLSLISCRKPGLTRPVSDIILFDSGANFRDSARSLISPDFLDPTLVDNGGRARALTLIRDNLVSVLHDTSAIEVLNFGPADLIFHKPGQRSTAFNYDTKTFMGLHLDNHQQYPLLERWKSYTLCGVNLGSSHRYFQFINLTVFDMLAACSLLNEEISHLTTNSLKSIFLERNPEYPVMRARLEPGQGYLCNTQDIIHDGATGEASVPDISFLFSFNPKP